jgi:hypothetical protein
MFGRPPPDPIVVAFGSRIDPKWSAYWVMRTLTDEPGKGMGQPFSQDDADLFLRACGLAKPTGPIHPADRELLERMWFWLDTHRD